MRVLLVTMYFPPAGGGGVPRPLKIAQHLSELGVETHVLTPTDPKRLHRDESLAAPPGVAVHRIANIGPGVRRPKQELRSRRGLARAGTLATLTFRRMLIPDPAVIWSVYSMLPAVRLIRRHGIDVVITSSPPISVNLVGAVAKRLTAARWVADLRDSIVAPPYLAHVVRGERSVARLVARNADAIVAVSEPIAEDMRSLGATGRVEMIDHGADYDDFEGLEYHPSERFRITHTGTMWGRRSPRAFLQAVSRSSPDVVARFAGDFRTEDRAFADQLGLGGRLEVFPYLPRREALALQRDSEALLLLVHDVAGIGPYIITTKVFEYLAAGRPILAAVPATSAVADLVREARAGIIVPPDDPDAIAAGIAELERRWRAGSLGEGSLTPEEMMRYSRRERVERLLALLETLR